MVWGAFTACDTLKLAYTPSRIDSIEYQAVLGNHLLPFLRDLRCQFFTFMQDNTKIHISRSTMSWFQSHNVNVLGWTSCSPDLNPIEFIWKSIKRVISHTFIKDLNHLRRIIFEKFQEYAKRLSFADSWIEKFLGKKYKLNLLGF